MDPRAHLRQVGQDRMDALLSQRGLHRLEPYVNNRTRIACTCADCLGSGAISLTELVAGGTPRCKPCAIKFKQACIQAQRIPIDQIRAKLIEVGSELRQDFIKWNYEPFKAKCSVCDADAFIRARYLLTPAKGRKASRPLCERHRSYDIPKGSDHPGYQPDADRTRRALDYEVRKWYKAVMERDNYTCQLSGRLGGHLAAHHLYSYKDYPEHRYDLANGITITHELHKAFHKMFGRRRNTPEQFAEFRKTHELDPVSKRTGSNYLKREADFQPYASLTSGVDL